MELVESYLELHVIPESSIRTLTIGGDAPWEEFLHSEERVISVLAGRGTGKTTNLARRAMESDWNCLILVSTRSALTMYQNVLGDLIESSSIRAYDHRELTYVFNNGRSIQVMTINEYRNFRGRRFSTWEVMFDEFDNSTFCELVSTPGYNRLLREARHIVSVGSLVSREINAAKCWFNDSDKQMFIDADGPIYNERFPEENRPSLMRQLLEHVPPLDLLA
jgi:hypothetical protein